jgi:hypothetical protein
MKKARADIYNLQVIIRNLKYILNSIRTINGTSLTLSTKIIVTWYYSCLGLVHRSS